MMQGGDGFLPPASATSKKHRCRVCGRCFPSGRSLGGHMRSHVYSSPPSPPADCFDERQGSYSLRENPKKSRRFCGDDGGTAMQCVECCREFASWKALFGHMRCHSEKGREERAERDGGSCASNGSQSDSGSRKRTSLWIGEAASASNCSFLTTDGEAEDGAIGLMLLSRGLRHWNRAAAAWGGEECSSYKNWEVLESSDLVPNATEKSGSELGDSRIEFKKVESDDEIEGGGFRGSEFEFGGNSSAMDNGGEKRSKFECKSCNKVFDSYQALGGHRASHKRIKGCHDTGDASVDHKPLLMAEAEAVRPPPLLAAAKATKKHQCSICNKLFSSGQALGGHKRSHLAAGGSAPGPDAASSMVIPQAQHHEMPNFFDLNDLPSEGSDEVKSWWSGGDLNREMMVGVILN